MTGDLHNIELMELAARIRAGDVSPVSVIRAQLDRIAALDGKLAYYGQVIAVDGGFTIGGLLG
jgi:amidase